MSPLPARTTRARTEVKTLLDTTRSRNIEIFLPSFPVSLSSLDKELNELLNCIKENSPLKIEHIVALKRCVHSHDISKIVALVKKIRMWQSWVEIEHYSIAYFNRVTAFEVL